MYPGDDSAGESAGEAEAPDSGAPSPPVGAPQSPAAPAGGNSGAAVLPPSAAPMAQPVAALGRQAEVRNQLKLMVQVLHQKSPLFEYNSPEGKAIQKALSALAPVFGANQQSDRTGAMATLMARQARNRGAQIPGGQQGPPMMPRGPAPTPGGAM